MMLGSPCPVAGGMSRPPPARPGSGWFLIFRQMWSVATLPVETAITVNIPLNSMKSPAPTGSMPQAENLV